eukprot:11212274-Lingulodinium_polyedra.AAC.1
MSVTNHQERHGGGPRQWPGLWARTKSIAPNDRIMREAKVSTGVLCCEGVVGQLNLPVLAPMDWVARRLQLVMEAYSNRPSLAGTRPPSTTA